MKKKIVVLLSLVLVMSVLLCGCGGAKSQITFSSGETLTAKEVRKLDNTSGYLDDNVTVEMTVKKVDAEFQTIHSNDTVEIEYFHFRSISIDDQSDDLYDVIETLQSGDKIKVTGRLNFIGTVQVTIDDVTNIQVIQ